MPALPRRLILAALPLVTLATSASGQGSSAGSSAGSSPGGSPVRLFRVQMARGEVLLGFTPQELAALGTGPEVERIARRIAEAGQLTAWRYQVGRAPDGGTRLGAQGRVAVLRQDALIVEPYAPALPVAPPPAE